MPKLLPLLEEAKSRRLAREKCARVERKRTALCTKYGDFIRDEFRGGILFNDAYVHAPPQFIFLQRSDVTVMIEDDSIEHVQEEQWAALFPTICLWAKTFRWKRLRALIGVLDGSPLSEQELEDAIPDLDGINAFDREMAPRLDLATSVFLCTKCTPSHVSWFSSRSKFPCLSYDGTGANLAPGPTQMVEAICRDLGLDPRTSSLKTLQDLSWFSDKYWLCKRCGMHPPRYYSSSQGMVGSS